MKPGEQKFHSLFANKIEIVATTVCEEEIAKIDFSIFCTKNSCFHILRQTVIYSLN